MRRAATADSDALGEIVRRAEVHYTTVGDMAYSVLRQAILEGVLAPGQHLRQDALAETLGVSRIPVRSALLQLESDGLIQLRPHRGAVVSMLTPERIREIYDVRIVLESHALRKAIATMTPERLARLGELAEEMDQQEQGDHFLEARISFYDELYDQASNPLLVDLIERLRADVGRYWLRRRLVRHSHEPSHEALLRHARAGDAEGAVRWLVAHLEQVRDQLVQLVERGGTED
jgi:DNA-binding GntR family transcriptional regulator